ncbi:flagellum-specific peptidoglycan hydrolase FlgJ [Neolewinella xylanilytica]|uniref:Flagellum-specific peptidoglycan hydrolase FlgJ n=1 Tax=Neolewinella xylanilytica TaxID=1514080 RepID=A0A2S6I0G4_9BACT|nr:glucosaminidase domain-containing protein [Neolewinella xylanilytica]PPK84351.1 flagellum-specific peptidoglycan hydrolase FlgJ [Neolewinella xylanilytica]
MAFDTTPTHAETQGKILNINWALLAKRLRTRGRQLFTSARHRAAQTEYIPPSWMTRLRLTWFRLGLIAIAAFVITQKQIDFTVSVGAPATETDGVASDTETNSTFSLIPGVSAPASAPKKLWSVADYDRTAVLAYIERFERVARTEAEKFAIPAPAKMAMAIVESQAGGSMEARENNNHFPMSTSATRYDNAWTSWRAHSQLMERRFPELAHESVNYQQYIEALVRTGYSRDPQYGQKLNAVIEAYDLADL